MQNKAAQNQLKNMLLCYMHPYTEEKWKDWLQHFSLQTNTDYKACTGRNDNKESDKGVLNVDGKGQVYNITWRINFMCSRGGKPRYKPNKSSDETKSVRDAPGSRLMECKATINVRLLKLDSREFVLQVCLPMSSAHSNHSPVSLQICIPTSHYLK